ncbi:MAG: hypothetical protein WC787_02665 [Patescibacteria group bacterium]|jgi:hypothetical protein
MGEKIPSQPPAALEKKEEAKFGRIENGEKIGVTQEAYEKYAKRIMKVNPGAKPVETVIGEWKPPQGKIPHDNTMYVASVSGERGKTLLITAMHPDEIDEERIRWIFGQVLPNAMGAAIGPNTSKRGIERANEMWSGLAEFTREWRAQQIRPIIEQGIADPGLRELCEKYFTAFPRIEIFLSEDVEDHGPAEAALNVLEAMHDLLAIPEFHMIHALKQAVADCEKAWRTLSEDERMKARKALSKAVVFP